MIEDFKSVIYSHKDIFTSMQEYKDFFNGELTNNKLDFSKIIPRIGLIFVVDITDEDSFNDALSIMKQIIDIENMSDKMYKTEKSIFLNKFDKISENKKISNIKSRLEQFSYQIKAYEISALSDWNLNESLTDFLSDLQKRFYVNDSDFKFNEEIRGEVNEERQGGCLPSFNKFGQSIFGGGFFSCGRGDV